MKHTEKLLDWFTRRSSITPLEALNDLGIYRLGSRVYDLREAGYDIHTERLTVATRDGGTSHPARYHFRGRGA